MGTGEGLEAICTRVRDVFLRLTKLTRLSCNTKNSGVDVSQRLK